MFCSISLAQLTFYPVFFVHHYPVTRIDVTKGVDVYCYIFCQLHIHEGFNMLLFTWDKSLGHIHDNEQVPLEDQYLYIHSQCIVDWSFQWYWLDTDIIYNLTFCVSGANEFRDISQKYVYAKLFCVYRFFRA